MYIRIEFIIILVVFFIMIVLVLGLGWYHLFLKMKGEGIIIETKKKQLEKQRKQEQEELNKLDSQEEVTIKIQEKCENTIEAKTGTEETEKTVKGNGLSSGFVISLFQEISVPMKNMLDAQDEILQASSISDAKRTALRAKKSGEIVFSIIDDILALSQMEAGEYEISQEGYNLDEIIQEVIQKVRSRANEKNIVFTTEINAAIPKKLIGDKKLIKRILTVLLNSAVENTEEGSVTLKLDYRMIKDELCLMGTVDDTGIGIRQEDTSFLFDLYERGEAYKRLPLDMINLGLNVCRKALELAGGSLDAESIYGTGSKFFFELPQKIETKAVEEEENLEKTEYIPPVVKENTKTEDKVQEKEEVQETSEISEGRILIVDDNFVNVKLLTGLLEPYELSVSAVYSGQQCLDEISQNQDYAVILLDHMMPEMDGIETLHRIRAMEGEYFANIPVIALTATVGDNVKELFVNEGFQDFVAKPVNIDELADVLRKYIHSENLFEEEKEKVVEEEIFGIEGVDIAIGLRQWNGNLDKYKMILEVVYTDGKLKLEEMKQHLANKDYEKYMIEAHSAKSVTASIGAMTVSELAKEQEFAVKNQSLDVVETKSEAFLQAYEKLLVNIGNSLHISEEPEQEPEAKELLPITVEEVERRFEKITELIEQYEDEEAVDQLEDLLKYNIEIYPVSFVKEIIENLNRLDYTKAGDRIKNRRSEFDEEDIISRR